MLKLTTCKRKDRDREWDEVGGRDRQADRQRQSETQTDRQIER